MEGDCTETRISICVLATYIVNSHESARLSLVVTIANPYVKIRRVLANRVVMTNVAPKRLVASSLVKRSAMFTSTRITDRIVIARNGALEGVVSGHVISRRNVFGKTVISHVAADLGRRGPGAGDVVAVDQVTIHQVLGGAFHRAT